MRHFRRASRANLRACGSTHLKFMRLERRDVPATVWGPHTVETVEQLAALGGDAWRPMAYFPVAQNVVDGAQVYLPLSLDDQAQRTFLLAAPSEEAYRDGARPLTVTLPDPDGEWKRFYVWRNENMEPALAAQYPEIRTYRGQGIDDPSAIIALDTTYAGFHAQVFSGDHGFTISPTQTVSDGDYVASFDADLVHSHAEGCAGAIDHAPTTSSLMGGGGGDDGDDNGSVSSFINGANLRTFRLAVAATGEYTAASGGTVPLALANINTVMNSINAIYERDLAVHMTLVANNNLIIYTNSGTDPYTGSDRNKMLGENQTTLDSVIGSGNYDIGHVFGGGNLGGIAYLGGVSHSAYKAWGVSTFYTGPTDARMPYLVGHEMGHQYGAGHTFNGKSAELDPNWTFASAFEPGSGSTIMSYGDVASGGQYVSPYPDLYFNGGSIDEMLNNLLFIPGIGTTTSTGNIVPVVDAGLGYVIPTSTFFALTATATDGDGDPLTYTWEQQDRGPQQVLGSPDNGSSPLFRTYPPTTNPTRYFRNLTDQINNTTSLPEVMPTTQRDLFFRVTVRDNKAGGGATVSDEVLLSVIPTGAPFKVTTPSSFVSWESKSSQIVTWDVADTSATPINATQVKILLSTDGGLTFPTTIVANTPNDGSEVIVVPNLVSTAARIKVQPVDNVFYDFSDANFSIPAASPMQVVSVTPANGTLVTTPSVTLDITFSNSLTVASVQTSDLTLSRGTVTGAQVLPDGKTARYTLSGITTEAPLTVTMPQYAVYDTGVNYNSQFITQYSVDITTESLPPFTAVAPLGSMVYAASSSGALSFVGDVDTFTASLDAGQKVTAVVRPGSTLQPRLTVTSPGGSPIDLDSSAAGMAAVAQSLAVGTAGVYTFALQGLASTTGSYSIALSTNAATELHGDGGTANNTTATAQDLSSAFVAIGGTADIASVRGTVDPGAIVATETESNNSTGTANITGVPYPLPSTAAYGLVISGNFAAANADDWFKLGTLKANAKITAVLGGNRSGQGTTSYPSLELRNSAGTTVAVGTYGGSGDGDGLIYKFPIPALDTYYLFASNTSGTYKLAVTAETDGLATSGSVTNESENNNTLATANDLSTSWRQYTYGNDIGGSLTFGDTDFFQMSFAAGSVVHFSTTNVVGTDSRLTLRNGAGTTLAYEDGESDGPGLGSLLMFRIPTTGVYTIEVNSNGDAGSYNLHWDYHSPTAVSVTTSDYYAFTLTAGQSVTLAAEGPTGVLDLDLVDAADIELAGGTSGATNVDQKVTFTATSSGTHYARVKNNIDYALVVTRSGTLDFEANDTHATAQTFTGDRAVGAVVASNVDWYQFAVTAGQLIVVSTTTPGDGPGEFSNTFDPTVDIYDPAAGFVGSDDSSAADGRNVNFARQATVTGNYRVQVRSNLGKNGEYVLKRVLLNGESPVLQPPPPQTTGEGKLFTYAPAITNYNPDVPLTFSLISPPSGMTIHPATGVVSWTPADQQVISACKIRVQITGVASLFDEETLPITVQNLPPTATFSSDSPTVLINTGTTVRFAATADAPTDTSSGFRYAYDFDNNGSFEVGGNTYATATTTTSAAVPPSYFNAVGQKQLHGRIYDKDDGYTDYTVTVNVAPSGAVGPEFRANVTTLGYQIRPDVAIDNDGDMVVVWQDNSKDGSSYGIFAQVFNSAGVGQGEFKVNTFTTASQARPAVAMDDDGDFVVVWQSYTADGSSYGIFAQRYSAGGAAIGSEFRVNQFTTGTQSRPDVALDANGDFVVAWQSFAQDGSAYGVYARRYDSSGAALGNEFQVNVYTNSYQSRASVAMTDAGAFVVTWQSFVQDGYHYGVYAQVYDAAGSKVGSEIQVNTYTTYYQIAPSVAMDADGDFVVAWQSDVQDGFGYGVYARRFSAAGAPLTAEIAVNVQTTYSQITPAVASDAQGGFVVSWTSYLQDGAGYGVYARRFNSAGVAQISDVKANVHTTGAQNSNAIAMDADGDYGIVWQSYGQDGGGYGIYGQRFVSNFAPTTTGLSPVTVNEDAADTMIPLSSAFDDYEDGGVGLTYTVGAIANPGLFAGASVIAGKLTLDYAPNASGVATVTLRGTDTGGKFVETTLKVTVNPVNDAPVLAAIGNKTIAEGSQLTFTASGSDPNDTPSDKLTYSLVGGPAGASIDANTGQFSWTPTDGPGQSATFKVRVTDDGAPNLFVEEEIAVTVENVAPTASFSGPTSGSVGQNVNFGFTGANDVSPDDVSAGFTYRFDWTNDGTFDDSGTSASVGHVYPMPGKYTVKGRVEDKDGGFKDYTQEITIISPPTVLSVTLGPGTQRSMVTQVVVAFSEAVNYTGADAFKLTRTGTGGTTGNVSLTLNPASGPASSVTITFSGGLTLNASLIDGLYDFEIDASKVSSANGALDGDGNGVGGDSHVVVGTVANKWFRLFGDVNGDGFTDNVDLIAFRAANGSDSTMANYNPALDVNGDGFIDNVDFIAFRQRLGLLP